MEKQRNPYFDALRGVAILMVVAIHTYNGATSLAEPAGCMAAAVRQLFNCAVPIFLAISGYFLSRKNMKTGGVLRVSGSGSCPVSMCLI